MRSPSPVAVVLATAIALAAKPVAADDNQSQAVEHFQKGRRLYQISDYRAALVEFKQAFLLKEDPVFLFNIGQCHRQLGEREEAITFYKRYVAAAPTAANRGQVERLIRELQTSAPPPPAHEAPPPQGPVPAKLSYAPPAPRSPEPARVVEVEDTPDRRDTVERSILGRWWFWAIVGVAAAAGGGAVLMSRRGPTDPVCPIGVKCGG